MTMAHPRRLIGIGTALLVAGAVVPFLMVARILDNSLLLSFASYAASVGGLFLGLLGVASLER